MMAETSAGLTRKSATHTPKRTLWSNDHFLTWMKWQMKVHVQFIGDFYCHVKEWHLKVCVSFLFRKKKFLLFVWTFSSPPFLKLGLHMYVRTSFVYLLVHMSKSFFLHSTISSKKSSSCAIIVSTPHLNDPKQLFNLSILSCISPWSVPSYSKNLSISAFSSSMAVFASRNS